MRAPNHKTQVFLFLCFREHEDFCVPIQVVQILSYVFFFCFFSLVWIVARNFKLSTAGTNIVFHVEEWVSKYSTPLSVEEPCTSEGHILREKSCSLSMEKYYRWKTTSLEFLCYFLILVPKAWLILNKLSWRIRMWNPNRFKISNNRIIIIIITFRANFFWEEVGRLIKWTRLFWHLRVQIWLPNSSALFFFFISEKEKNKNKKDSPLEVERHICSSSDELQRHSVLFFFFFF